MRPIRNDHRDKRLSHAPLARLGGFCGTDLSLALVSKATGNDWLQNATYCYKRDASENTKRHGEEPSAEKNDQENLFARIQPRLPNNLERCQDVIALGGRVV